ncbi:MAG: 30S ribosomal protein S6 [Luteitalea sp.]|nr:30S ribosomal protein S6 [Acidobacteriota bacterium]
MATHKQYELVYIASPDATEEQLTELQTIVEGIVTKAEGVVDKVDVWGRRRLAYPIGRLKEGHYVVVLFSSEGTLVKELDRRLKVNDLIVRHLIVRVDEELQKAARAKSRRDAETARRRVARGLPPEPTPEELLAKQAALDSRDEAEG